MTPNRSADQADHVDPWPDRDYSKRDRALLEIAAMRAQHFGDTRQPDDLYQPA